MSGDFRREWLSLSEPQPDDSPLELELKALFRGAFANKDRGPRGETAHGLPIERASTRGSLPDNQEGRPWGREH